MRAGLLRNHEKIITSVIPTIFPLTGMGWTDIVPDRNTVFPDKGCIFRYMRSVSEGVVLCFSNEKTGCPGANCYFGFSAPDPSAGCYLAEKEKFKKSVALGEKFYRSIRPVKADKKYLIWGNLHVLSQDMDIEVVNCWVNSLGLAGLATLANFDRENNNNVTSPFASGCQSMWTLPLKERNKKNSRAIIGGLDPAMRRYIPVDSLLVSFSTDRFITLCTNIPSSFATTKKWSTLISGNM